MRAGPRYRWFLLAALAVVLAATLSPIAGEDPERWLACVFCGEHGTADVVVNVILFLPFGAALAAAGLPLSRCLLVGALLSAGVEFAQLYVPGRDPSLGDVVADALGSGLGAALVAAAPYWLVPSPSRAARLCRGAAVAAAALCYLTGWLLTPAPPRRDYVALWTPNIVHLEWYRGRVLSARIGDISLAPGPIANPAGVREELSGSRDVTLLVRAIAGPRTTALGGLLAVYDDGGREVLLLGPDRDDLVFRLRTRAATIGLDQPDIRAPRLLRSAAPGDTLDVQVRGRGGRYAMMVGPSGAAGLGFTVGNGWAMLMHPEALPRWLTRLLELGWVAALWAPAGFWVRARSDGWMLGGAVAAGLLGAPALTALCVTPPVQWAAAGLGAVAGAGVRLVLDRYRPPSALTSSPTQRSMRA